MNIVEFVTSYTTGGYEKMISPCADCDHRKVGCHGSCKEYKDWHHKLIYAKYIVTAQQKAGKHVPRKGKK